MSEGKTEMNELNICRGACSKEGCWQLACRAVRGGWLGPAGVGAGSPLGVQGQAGASAGLHCGQAQQTVLSSQSVRWGGLSAVLQQNYTPNCVWVLFCSGAVMSLTGGHG